MIFGASVYIMAPVIALSVISLALILERTSFYITIRWRYRVNLQDLLNRIGKESSGKLIDFIQPQDKSPERELLSFALQNPSIRHPSLYEQGLVAVRDKLHKRLEKNLPILNGIANASTLLGLLGTVSGMIQAFRTMSETASSNPYVLAGSISQALVTTAAGLIVAIPSILAVYFFESVVEKHLERMDMVVNECLFISGFRYSREKKSQS